MLVRRAVMFLVGASVGAAAGAAETITYTFDARGRVIRVVKTGSVNNGITDEYTHDKSNNRVLVKVTGAATSGP